MGGMPPALAEPDPNQALGQVLAQTTPWQTLLGGLTRPLPRGLRYCSRAEQVIEQRVRAVGQMLQIDGLLNRYPRQLSAEQRVALGRAMARNPQAFLMDEPSLTWMPSCGWKPGPRSSIYNGNWGLPPFTSPTIRWRP
jgi:multiple sugar transport system ATP-binding protein